MKSRNNKKTTVKKRTINTFTPHKGIFFTLFFTLFATVTGVGIVVPLLPVYAEHLGAAGIQVGLIFGSFSLSRTLFLPWFGKLSDQKGRKTFILMGLAGYTLMSIAFIAGDSVTALIFTRFFQGIASAMVMPVVQAYVGEITPRGKEGYTMGLFNMSMFASLSIGPILGGVITDAWSMDTAFLCMGLLAALGFALSAFYLPPVSREPAAARETTPIAWKLLFKTPSFAGLFIYRFAYTACISIIWCFIPLFAQNRFNLSGSSTGILVTLGIFISGLLQIPMGKLADAINKRWMVIIGGILCGIAFMLIFTAATHRDLLLAISFFGLGGGISMPAIMAMGVILGHEKNSMASVMSMLTVAHSAGMMVGAMGAGGVMDYFSLEYAFPCGTILMATGVILFFIFTRSLSLIQKKISPARPGEHDI
ncbi:Predicted arabinose efflux permease, MFS family [Desulfocicer vacuolatum DSM 3385]|uniref:Predicted arabinose efflux permease, MFS family n=1 Tax=Desulfocicer vacuolatum DSM 3385 TaxID=1121400 RepID=A0A1W1YPM7_9BACT|nr:MFS transporter [Desulfocicer vacuolatum]SMC38155.1 Predicted arabinose efflux permease, MFS family [Desulfocicer vacuolatum DSM 3385]